MSSKLRNLLSAHLFCEIVTSGVILSLSGFELFNVNDYFSVKFAARLQFAVYTTLELLIFSHAAENIKMESENVAEKIYQSRWYDRTKDAAVVHRLMLTSMMRASQSVKISAMGFSDVSYETFVNVRYKLQQYFHFLEIFH